MLTSQKFEALDYLLDNNYICILSSIQDTVCSRGLGVEEASVFWERVFAERHLKFLVKAVRVTSLENLARAFCQSRRRADHDDDKSHFCENQGKYFMTAQVDAEQEAIESHFAFQTTMNLNGAPVDITIQARQHPIQQTTKLCQQHILAPLDCNKLREAVIEIWTDGFFELIQNIIKI